LSATEIVAAAAAVGAAATAAFAISRPKSAAVQPSRPDATSGEHDLEKPETTPKPADGDARVDYLSSLFGAWSGLITTAGAIAASVGTYQLAKDIGKGETDGASQTLTVLATAGFALGIALLITIPVSLRARNFVTLADAVRSQKHWNFFAIGPIRKHLVVGTASLLGHGDIVEFESAMTSIAFDVRKFIAKGLTPPLHLTSELRVHNTQLERIERSIAMTRVRSASRRAVSKAGFGMVLAVAGFSFATLLTNHADRLAASRDKDTEYKRRVDDVNIATLTSAAVAGTSQANHLEELRVAQVYKLEEKVLTARLAEPTAVHILPTVPSDVTVSMPDAATAAAAYGVTESTLDESCWTSRKGTTYDLGKSPDPKVPADRIVFVVFPRSELCRSVAVWVNPGWLLTKTPAVTVASAPASGSTTTTRQGLSPAS
jgi:hypothetical protein